MHKVIEKQLYIQRNGGMMLLSLDIACFPKKIVHFYSYTSIMFLGKIEKSTESLFDST